MSRGRAKSNEALDLARVFKTMIEGLNKAHILLPAPVFEECLKELVTSVNQHLDALPNRLLLALDPKDKVAVSEMIRAVIDEIKQDLSQIRVDVPRIASELTERGFSFSPDNIRGMVSQQVDEEEKPKRRRSKKEADVDK